MTKAPSSTPDPGRARRRWSRLLQLVGLIVASVGLPGIWLHRDVPRTELSEFQRQLLGVEEGTEVLRFVLAGRDRVYWPDLSTPVYAADGRIVGWDYAGPRGFDGNLTDTVLYVSVVGDVVTLIAIPRDLYLDAWQRCINSMYAVQGADGLRRAVEVLLGLPVDYYVISNLDLFESVVDALGGVEVNVPTRMLYSDRAEGLHIDLRPGPLVLDGAAAAGFVRFRESLGGDFDRLDDVETNASPVLVRDLLPRLARFELREATLPSYERTV